MEAKTSRERVYGVEADMTEQEFLEFVLKHTMPYYKTTQGTETYYVQRSKKKKKLPPEINDVLYVKWLTGGVGGGSYMEPSTYYPIEAEPEPELDSLNLLIDVICPEITLKKHKVLMNNLVQYESRTTNEYYGNSYVYCEKTVSLKKLFERLKELGLV